VYDIIRRWATKKDYSGRPLRDTLDLLVLEALWEAIDRLPRSD
jgi:hypothetical protein